MKQKALSMKSYLSKNEHYSDLLNAVLFNGEQKVLPETLKNVSTNEINQILKEDGTTYYEVNRDILKQGIFKSDGKDVYCLFGVENQTNVDLRMPIRIMEYDALAYKEQVKNLKPNTNDSVEFLSHMSRSDKLITIITLVFNLSNAEWNGPRSPHDMLATNHEELLKYIPEYKLNLVSPYEMSDEEGMYKPVTGNKEYKRLDRETVQVIRAHTKLELEINEKEEVIDMCKAIEDMKATSRREGKVEGKEETLLESINSLIRKLSLSVEDAMELLNIP